MAMRVMLFTPVVLSLLVLGAHFLRYGNEIGVVGVLVVIGLLFVRKAWVARLVQAALVLGALEWVLTLYTLLQMRAAIGAPTSRLVIILGVVIVVTAASALLFETKTMKQVYRDGGGDGAEE